MVTIILENLKFKDYYFVCQEKPEKVRKLFHIKARGNFHANNRLKDLKGKE